MFPYSVYLILGKALWWWLDLGKRNRSSGEDSAELPLNYNIQPCIDPVTSGPVHQEIFRGSLIMTS